MDSNIVAAFIAGIAAICAAIITSRKKSPDPKTDIRGRYLTAIGILVVGFTISIFLFINTISKYKKIIPDFGYTFRPLLQTNSSMYIEHQKNMTPPNTICWLIPNAVEITWIGDPNLLQTINTDSRLTPVPKECLYIESHLRSTNSWSGFMFSKCFDISPVDLSQKTEMLLILNADNNDIVEIGLRDVEGNETKLKVPIKSGWHGYAIPVANFRNVNNRCISLFLFAHSSTVSFVADNKFWISYIGFR
jgi:hypothetical protein